MNISLSNIVKINYNMKIFFTIILLVLFTGISHSQNSPQQTFDNGLEAFYDGRYQDGVKFFTDYISTNNTDFKGYNYRGLCFQALKNYPRSIEDFTRVITVTPNNFDGYLNRGNSYFFNNNNDAAMRDYKDAIRLAPKDFEAYFGMTRILMKLRRFDEALKELNSAEGIDPMNARVYINKSLVHMQLQDTVALFNDVATVMYYDSNIVFTDYRRDLLYVKIETYKAALASVNQQLALHPNSYIYYFMRGFIYYLMNSYSKAKADFETSVKINVKNDEQYNKVIETLYRSIKRNNRM